MKSPLAQGLVALGLFSGALTRSTKSTQVINFLSNPLTVARLDPIVAPGESSTHLHIFFGGGALAPEMSAQQGLDAKCTGNNIKANKNNYWSPYLFFQAPNGSFFPVQAREFKVYYRFEQTDDDMKAFPPGLQVVAGDPLNRQPIERDPTRDIIDPENGPIAPYEIKCDASRPDNKFTDQMCNHYGGLRQDIYFPQCYNPEKGLTNHRENMAYATRAGASAGAKNCPPGWIHVPQLKYEIYWDIHKFDGQWQPNTGYVPWVLAHGDRTGAGTHADFMAFWDTEVLQRAIDTCDSAPETMGNSGFDYCFPDLAVTPAEANACTIASPVDEQVWGELKELPGCNPVQEGPERAQPATCAGQTPLGGPSAQYKDVSGPLDWEYHGCFTDMVNFVRTVEFGPPPMNGPTTVERCIEGCANMGHTMAGLEFGEQCFCGNEVRTGEPGNGQPSSLCSMPCAGDPSEICGNVNAISVYRKCGPDGCKNGSAPSPNGQVGARPRGRVMRRKGREVVEMRRSAKFARALQ